MKYYIILYQGDLYHNKRKNGNNCAFTEDEAKALIKIQNWNEAQLICINDDLDKQENEVKHLLENSYFYKILSDDESVYTYKLWYDLFLNNNLNFVKLPIKVKTNKEYIQCVKQLLNDYCNSINTVAFKYEKDLLSNVRNLCTELINALDYAVDGNVTKLKEIIKSILKQHLQDPFWVSELDKSYAFRGIAPFYELREKNYDPIYKNMLEGSLDFYRARPMDKESNVQLEDRKEMLHLPYSLKEKASEMRFSKKLQPCLYFGTSSFVCSEEVKWNSDNQNMYIAAFKPNEDGKRIKVLNLVVSQAMINGFYDKLRDNKDLVKRNLQNSMLEIYPIIIATSFTVEDNKREKKFEYIISQTIMDVMKELGIEAVAYLSRQGEDEFQYPYGVNLAILADDISENKEYSKYCGMFKMTKPMLMGNNVFSHEKGSLRCYLNRNYPEYDKYGYENYIARISYNGEQVYYGNTLFGQFDDKLVNEEYKYFQ